MRVIRGALKWAGILLLALIVTAAIYQQFATLIDDATVPRRGQFVFVHGRRVHIVCTGAGRHLLVLDAGLGAAAFEWSRIQPLLARNARVCAFDRPGQGASDAIAHAYDGVTAADELHDLVAVAGWRVPFVYVGHSLGANFAQIYAARFPRDVAAIVLVEPGVPADLRQGFHGSRADALALPATCGAFCFAGWIAGALAIPRIVVTYVHTGSATFGDDSEALAEYRAAAARTSNAGVSAAYFAALPKLAYQVEDARLPRGLPVLILASAIDPPPDDGETPADVRAWRLRQHAWFTALAAASDHGDGPVVIPGATHASMVMGSSPLHTTATVINAFLAGLR